MKAKPTVFFRGTRSGTRICSSAARFWWPTPAFMHRRDYVLGRQIRVYQVLGVVNAYRRKTRKKGLYEKEAR